MSKAGSGMRCATAALAALALAGCGRAVIVEPGPFAPDPVCAQIILSLPRQLAGLDQASTSAQATVAWGETDPIVLRCGVEPPPPTDARCVSVESGSGVTVDWINPEADSDLIPSHGSPEQGAWTFISYGRTPAVELVIPAASGVESPAEILVRLALAIDNAPASRFCVGPTDL